jgi:hypothetical protein
MPRAGLTAAAMGGAVGLALLSGCADMQDNVQDVLGDLSGESRTMVFECDDDRDLTVRLSDDREEAYVDADGRDYELEEAGEDDGRHVYSDDDDDVRLTLGNDDAHLRVADGDDYEDCEET